MRALAFLAEDPGVFSSAHGRSQLAVTLVPKEWLLFFFILASGRQQALMWGTSMHPNIIYK